MNGVFEIFLNSNSYSGGNVPATTYDNSIDANFGRRADGTGYFKGIIYQTAIYSRALTSTDAFINFASGPNGSLYDNTNLVQRLKLNEGYGTTAYDTSGNNNDAALANITWTPNSYSIESSDIFQSPLKYAFIAIGFLFLAGVIRYWKGY